MTTNPANAIDREDLQRSHDESRFGPLPEPGPKASTATPAERQSISEWLRGGMNAAIEAGSFEEYVQQRWKNWKVEEDEVAR